MLINLPLFFLWNKDNNNFEWLKMGKWVTKCSVNILAPWTPGVSRKQTYSPRGCTQWMKRRELAFSQGHREHSWVERRELGLLSDWREWASTNLAPGGIIGGSWPPKIESMGARVWREEHFIPTECKAFPPLTSRRENLVNPGIILCRYNSLHLM